MTKCQQEREERKHYSYGGLFDTMRDKLMKPTVAALQSYINAKMAALWHMQMQIAAWRRQRGIIQWATRQRFPDFLYDAIFDVVTDNNPFTYMFLQRPSWTQQNIAASRAFQLQFVRSSTEVASRMNMSRAMRKCVLCHMRTTKAQISVRIRAVWSAPLLFAA